VKIYTVTVAVEAATASAAAALVQTKVEGRGKKRTAAVIRVEDDKKRVVWRGRDAQ
jgi:hypothetical protein